MTIFDKSVEGKIAFRLPEEKSYDFEPESILSEKYIKKSSTDLPECSELDVVRHYSNLAKINYSVDHGFYPLGSCTMKYNPKINENVASLNGFANLHPLMEEDDIQGALELMFDLQNYLSEITGMDEITLQPAAGAHGELTGMLITKKYFQSKNENRKKVLIPDSAHGTNPASAIMAGFDVVELKSDENGILPFETVKNALNKDVAAIMMTNPNTLGLFEKDIVKIARIAHENGTLLYYDGANLNAIMGKIRPGDMGFDIIHLNLHKTFSTPHGMGGPGSGPVGVKKDLREFLPVPIVNRNDEKFYFDYDLKNSIGKMRSYYGNFGVLVRAYAYILSMGNDGLKKASELAVLNANYIKCNLMEIIPPAFEGVCKHEYVGYPGNLPKEYNVKTLNIAKRMLDYGIHPPTIYFPLIVHEALMIEPTETESKETLDSFIEITKKIVQEAKTDPKIVIDSPHNTYVRKLDEAKASRKPKVRWNKSS